MTRLCLTNGVRQKMHKTIHSSIVIAPAKQLQIFRSRGTPVLIGVSSFGCHQSPFTMTEHDLGFWRNKLGARAMCQKVCSTWVYCTLAVLSY